MTFSDTYLQRTNRNHFWLGGEKAQQKMKNLRVGIAGLGGMGSGVALTLARMGVNKFNLADPDRIEITNLNRQVIANQTTIGKTKLETTIEELKKIDTSVEIVGFDQGIEEATINGFLEGVDVVVDEIDVFPIMAHRILHREANKKNISLYSAYVVGLGVHLYKFSGSDYNLNDFYQPIEAAHSSLTTGIIETFVRPVPAYFKTGNLAGYTAEVESGNVPIFGPSCLLGHSLISMRLILDYMSQIGEDLPFSYEQMPTMPEFIVVDPISFSMTIHSLELPKSPFIDKKSS